MVGALPRLRPLPAHPVQGDRWGAGTGWEEASQSNFFRWRRGKAVRTPQLRQSLQHQQAVSPIDCWLLNSSTEFIVIRTYLSHAPLVLLCRVNVAVTVAQRQQLPVASNNP